ncbi:hydroxyethylthiazole kinase [Ensifer sp. T173]|uniref:hydroxyethylthiazole kinase n=1 Tax=Ensifer canadensis TaxID=555315 RepID=A0AAW4FW44_9HYPH|nr:hydroxyethylthiazole kinase [Ensifer canadensis]MBM3095523.1 hydroxyethylthiazole kinase [Ensifer canadensis]UBI79118.1 hydroxyethylthiazole kinase [Ensifer canadensis]
MTGTSDFVESVAASLALVRQRRPRVHCLMNTVVQKFVADGLAALGAIPSMTSALEEVEAFAQRADALVVNLGTLDEERRRAIRLAAAVARDADKPWIVDPVHCDYSPSRLVFARELIAAGPSVVRGNASEMDIVGNANGALRIKTGAVDELTLDLHTIRVENGHPLMAQVTGTGCLSGALIAAFMAVEPDRLKAATGALLTSGIAAEIAGERSSGPGTFEALFRDALAALRPEDIIVNARISHAES